MASLIQPLAVSTISTARINPRSLKLMRLPNLRHGRTSYHGCIKHSNLRCTNMSAWEPAPVTYAPENDDDEGNFLKGTSNIFETLASDKTDEAPLTNIKQVVNASDQPWTSTQLQYFKWPLWLVGPSLLLATGMAPTLWLPTSSIFLGPNVASLLSLTGLDCIFNLGASLFLLMADSCARPKNPTEAINSKAPFSYQFWNMVATITGFIIPLAMVFGSQKGFLQPLLPSISFGVLLGPYLLLLSVQMLTEMLIWHWQSPVWLVTPVIYEAYRVLQLMRGLKLGVELNAPAWMMHTIRGLVCWWVLILGVQLMRVAWYAGFTTRAHRLQSSAPVDTN
ncbi:ATP synthase subunit a like [Actinidia chinensis var. chinensis]|uniref:ATP synthase subunit a like n=1 Tax=Actinidia chinensis var. chinensis TaxID=1590841 RepID=A0A2R6S132_ACTCC|nr:ATP synthase subunit a like [Actinidia chinensis var. chinensis]